MALVDDVVIALGAGVSTASFVILLTFLSRYRSLVEEAKKSNELAKNLWDAMNARLTVQDARIVDLMARLEVYSVRKTLPAAPAPLRRPVSVPPPTSMTQTSEAPVTVSQPISRVPTPQMAPRQSVIPTNDTELTILRTLLEGPKMSNDIRAVIQVTREHNGRLLKGLFDRGLVSRTDEHKPFVYQITEQGKAYLSSSQPPS